MSREKELSKITIWGAVANVSLTAVKFLAGFLGKSSAMLADAVHSLSDLVSDIVVLVMVKVSAKDKDKGHDYGHGKFETLATLAVSVLLIVAGAELLADGIRKIKTVIGGGTLDSPGSIALWAALLSIAVKEALYQWTAAVGRKNNSPAVISNAWHHRTDAFSSIASALGIGCAIVLGGKWAILDPVTGCLISLFIFVIAVKMCVPALNELTDGSLPEDMEADMKNIIQSVPGVRNAHAMKTRKIGPNVIIECHLVVNGEISVNQAHRITDAVEDALRAKYGPETQISLHTEPYDDGNQEMPANHFKL